MLESKRRAIIFLSISLLLAFIAGLFFLQKIKELNSELGGMTKIYVTATDIPSRTLLQPDHVKQIEIPNRYVNNSHVVNVEDLIDKVLVVPLVEDDLITKSMLKPVSNATDENNRLVTMLQSERIRFDEELEGLDRVDIVVSHKFDGKPVTEVFMKDVLVAGVSKSGKQFSGVALEVPADDAPRIIHIQNYADSIRVLKANVGKAPQLNTDIENKETEEQKEEKTEPPQEQNKENTETPAEPPQEPKKENAEKPANENENNKK
ncbi:Flp pilus assembly protein CpaB [Cytobacillus dafuensis]|uniref:Flp pilus assembly protein CpaB n=1 Tax=Cytobacillus dafuensis TaxID=1742359 RepID=A0A5B8Z0U7_CYTDA|nr:SAF domain-containing protein [Cytobacillus dafuensis]QED46411.1 flp pilus assembly protein CpaB [Cytobacillus dafuensis]